MYNLARTAWPVVKGQSLTLHFYIKAEQQGSASVAIWTWNNTHHTL